VTDNIYEAKTDCLFDPMHTVPLSSDELLVSLWHYTACVLLREGEVGNGATIDDSFQKLS